MTICSVIFLNGSWQFLLLLQETGNRMSEQNLAMIIGPNILHKELKVGVEHTRMFTQEHKLSTFQCSMKMR